MAIDTTDLESIYDTFLTKTTDKLKSIYDETNMEDEHYAQALGVVITGAMENSVRSMDVVKRGELVDKQVITEEKKALDIVSSTSVRDAQSTQDLLNKASEKSRIDAQTTLIGKQEITEEKKALDIENSTTLKTNASVQDILNKQKQVELFAQQIFKSQADEAFVNEQKLQLIASVSWNNKIKALSSYADMIGTIGAAGLTVKAPQWTLFFDMIHSLIEASDTYYADIGLVNIQDTSVVQTV